jgi:hypothetical protein
MQLKDYIIHFILHCERVFADVHFNAGEHLADNHQFASGQPRRIVFQLSQHSRPTLL